VRVSGICAQSPTLTPPPQGLGRESALRSISLHAESYFGLVTLLTFLTLHALMHVFIKYWLPLLIWLCVIFVGSTDVLSAEHTSRFIVPILLWLKPGMRPQTILSILIIMRKCAHVTEYAILALLLWRALRSAPALRTKMSIVFGAVLLACVVFAVSDEFHQSFVKSRTPTVRDVLLDGAGALFGLLIGVGFAKRDSKKVRSTARNDVVNARL